MRKIRFCVVSNKGADHLRRWYQQVKKRRGSQKAITGLSRKILVIVWAMLRDNTTFIDPDSENTDQDKSSRSNDLHRQKLRDLDVYWSVEGGKYHCCPGGGSLLCLGLDLAFAKL